MTRLNFNAYTGKFTAKKAAPRYRSWDLLVSKEGETGNHTHTYQTKREAVIEKKWFEANGYSCSDPIGNTRKF